MREGSARTWRLLTAIMVALVLLSATVAIGVLYRAAIAAEISRIGELTRSQARLIESVAQFDAIHSRADHPEGATMATLGQVAEGHSDWLRRDSSLFILVASQSPEGPIALVMQGQVVAANQRRDIPPNVSPLALGRSLLGEQGAILTAQADGRDVIVGYDFIATLRIGIVLQVDLAKVRQPFVRATVFSVAVAFCIALLGATVFRHASLPMIEELRRELRERRAAEVALERHKAGLEDLVIERTRELKRAQEDLLKTEKLATLGRVLATVSHELRNPLGTLKNTLFALTERTQGKDLGLESIIARAARSGERCNMIVDELLTFSRVRAPKMELIALHKWLADFLLESEFPVAVRIENTVAEACQIMVDVEDLRRCFSNLISNGAHAIESAGRHHGEGQITINAIRSGSNWVIAVRDNGIGIADDVLPKVLDPLFSTKTFGVGLGLSIVHDAVVRNGGAMSIESAVGLGTDVLIQFPIPPQEGG